MLPAVVSHRAPASWNAAAELHSNPATGNRKLHRSVTSRPAVLDKARAGLFNVGAIA
jgi:hypothetical protein